MGYFREFLIKNNVMIFTIIFSKYLINRFWILTHKKINWANSTSDRKHFDFKISVIYPSSKGCLFELEISSGYWINLINNRSFNGFINGMQNVEIANQFGYPPDSTICKPNNIKTFTH